MVSGTTWGTAEEIYNYNTIPDDAPPSTLGTVLADVAPAYIYHLAGRIAHRHDPFHDLKTPGVNVRHSTADLLSDLDDDKLKLPKHSLVYVGWDDDNDMHGGTMQRGDENLHNLKLVKLVVGRSKWFNLPDENGIFPWLFSCYDEDRSKWGGRRENNHVFACWWRPLIKPRVIDTCYTHYSFCDTITANWGKEALNKEERHPQGQCPAETMGDVFGP
jgi:hypothetical protein